MSRDDADGEAPRLRAYLENAGERPVLVAQREAWDSLGLSPDDELQIDVAETPLGEVSSEATVLASIARQYSNTSGELVVYRDDPKDKPERVNVDQYDVWTDLQGHPDFDSIVESASTTVNENMHRFLDNHVFFAKRDPGADHRLEELPASVSSRLTESPTRDSNGL